MSKKLRLQRGEIATIITIVSLIILGASTLVSSVFLSKNKQTTSTRASTTYPEEVCNSANNWHCTGETRTCSGGTACGVCAKSGTNTWSRCVGPNCKRSQSTQVYTKPAFDLDNSCNLTATIVPTQGTSPTTKTPTPSPIVRLCSYWISTAACGNFPSTCEWNNKDNKCVNKTQPTSANIPTPTRAPGNELPGYEDCKRCCIEDKVCNVPADGNGYKCGKDEIRIRWYSYNCTSSCSSFGSGTLTKFTDCPSDVGRENRLKCVSGTGICSTYYGGAPYPTSTDSNKQISTGILLPTIIPANIIAQGECLRTNCGGANSAFNYYQKCASPYGDTDKRLCGKINYYSNSQCSSFLGRNTESWCNDQKRDITFRIVINSISGSQPINYDEGDPTGTFIVQTPDIGGVYPLCSVNANIPREIKTDATFECTAIVKKNFTNVNVYFIWTISDVPNAINYGEILAKGSYITSGPVIVHFSL